MPSRNTIEIQINAKDNASGVLEGVGSTLGGIGKAVATGATVLLGATVAIGGIALNSAMDSQNVLAQLDARLKSTGGAAGVTRQAAIDLASGLQQVTAYSDETILSGENLMLTFTNVGKDVFPDATTAAVDMSAALGQDLQSSVMQLGKALNAPIEGTAALGRVGVKFTQATKDQIKALVESGRTMDAQKIILKELQTEFGGAAKAAGQTLSGKIAILKNKFEEVFETIGGKILPIGEKFVALLSSLADKVLPVIMPLVDSIANGLMTFFQALSDGVSPLDAIGMALFRVFGEGARPIAEFLQNAGQLFTSFIGAVQQFISDLQSGGITNAIANLFMANEAGVGGFIENLLLGLGLGKEGVESFLVGLTNGFLTVKNFLEGTVRPALEQVFGWLSTVWSTVVEPGLSKMEVWFTVTAIPAISKAISDFKTLYFEPVANWLSTVWSTIIEPGLNGLYIWFTTGGLKSAIDGVINFFNRIGELPGQIQKWIDQQGFLAQRLEDFIIAMGIGIVVFGVYNGLVTLAGIVSTAAAAGIGAMRAAIALMLGPLGLAIIAITALIALYHQLQTFQQQVSTAVQGSISPTAQAIKNGLTHDQYMDKAFASTVNEMGDAAARIFWANGGQTLFERTWQTAYAEANSQPRDRGGPGRAGGAYMIGKGAQPEMFIPSSNGTFIPNADKMMGGSGITVESLVINANDAAGGAAAGHAFIGVLDEWQSRGNR